MDEQAIRTNPYLIPYRSRQQTAKIRSHTKDRQLVLDGPRLFSTSVSVIIRLNGEALLWFAKVSRGKSRRVTQACRLKQSVNAPAMRIAHRRFWAWLRCIDCGLDRFVPMSGNL